MFDFGFSSNRFRSVLVLIAILSFAWASNAGAWRILMAEPIPEGALNLTSQEGSLWCSYEIENDSLMFEIDPVNGDILQNIEAPGAECLGIGTYEDAIWFLGPQQLYQLGDDGVVIDHFELPYESMKGLAGTEDGIWTVVNENGIRILVMFVPGQDEVHRFETTLQNVGDITWDSQYIWVTDTFNGFMHIFDPAIESEIDIYPTPVSRPTGITFIDESLYLIDAGHNEDTQMLYRIDPTGQSTPYLLTSADNYDFGNVLVFSDNEWALALHNIGNEILVVDSVRLASGESGFEIGQLPDRIEIAMDRHAMVNLTFSPQSYDVYRDTLIIASNDPVNRIWRVAVSGTGLFPSRHLMVYPEELNFGVVRADPWRDGSRVEQLGLINVGIENLRIDSLKYSIEDIFSFEFFEVPDTILPADTMMVNFWFTPHNGIEYIDTLLIYSNRVEMLAAEIIMRGQGSDSIFFAGTSMWQLSMGNDGEGTGSASRAGDINQDGIDEVVAVGEDGTVYCLNGFGSGEADAIWVQYFDNQAFSPEGILPKGCISGINDLNGDGFGDIILGSGIEDRSVYSLNGLTGDLLWRWDSRDIGGEGAILRIHTDDDRNGDGSVDPVVLTGGVQDGQSHLVRIDGATGRAVWLRNTSSGVLLESLGDINRDGVCEYALATWDGNLNVYSGADGGLLNIIETGLLAEIALVSDMNGDETKDIICALVDGGLAAWSIFDGEALWEIAEIDGGVPLGTVIQMEVIHPSGENETEKLAGFNAEGTLFVLDIESREAVWFDQTRRAMTCISLYSDLNEDSQMELLAGFENGRIECRSGSNGVQLWAFIGDEVGWEPVYTMFMFEDIDLGGSVDLVGLFGDGTVRCISSGGDLGVESNDNNTIPVDLRLDGIYPNPFNGPAELLFSTRKPSDISLSIFDLSGRMVESVSLGICSTGTYRVSFDPEQYNMLASGVYLFVLNGASQQSIYKGILLK